jgi:hypothetical protein
MTADGVRAAPRRPDPIGWTTFELSSRGGYARTVTGLVAYLDDEAETYIVLGRDGALRRVPVREIMSSRDASDGDRPPRGRDTTGLGTGDVSIR